MEDIISDNLIEKYFKQVKSHLLNKRNRIPLQLSRQWCKSFPKDAGVYCFFIDDNLGYVGETGSLRKRLADLLDSRNHTLRRTVGEKYFSKVKGYAKASSSIKFPVHVELLVEKWMAEHLKVSLFPVKIGRKEFEEWLQHIHPEIEFLNKRKKRKQ